MMTERDLLDRMTESTQWTRTAAADPILDVARGRARLRRRRASIATTVVAVGAASALGISALGAPGGTMIAGDTPAVASSPRPLDPPVASFGASRLEESNKSRLHTILATHLDPQWRHLGHPLSALLSGSATSWGQLILDGHWSQDGGRNSLIVEIAAEGAPPDPTSYFCGPKPPYAGYLLYECGWQRVAGGKRVLVGRSNFKGVKSYLVRYLRPDGQTVTIRVQGPLVYAAGVRAKPPVKNPRVTVEQLIAAVTDPQMRVRER